MYNFSEFVDDKNQLIRKIEKIKLKISELQEIGIDVSESLHKLDSTTKMISEEKISVVLVGAFSDGKTSVVAGWLNEKMDNMKIDSDESSDEILCYTPDSLAEGCRIIDTPGLFGDKIGSDENGAKLALSDITKKFISEANLILYVVTAKNPIKDSHKECIRWILKDLNKLSTTIFVINRMDDVADLTDEEDYGLQARIKTENLRGKLLECGLSEKEAQNVKVACISAAPNGKGIDGWKEYRDEYLRRSHLEVLENTTNSILQESKEHLITKTGCDVLNDEVTKMVDTLSCQERMIADTILPEQKESLRRNEKDLDNLHKRLMRSRKDMKDALKALKKKKSSMIRAASMENFKDIMEDEIGIIAGKEGHVLNDEINDIFQEYAEIYSNWTMELGKKFQAEYNRQNEAMDDLVKKGVKGASIGLGKVGNLGVDAIKHGIFVGRDLLGKLGVVVKFKPWQVTKLATFATKALPVIGAGIDIVSNIVENVTIIERNKKFEKSKDSIKGAIDETFDEIYSMMANEESFIDTFAPQYRILESQIQQDKVDITHQEIVLNRFRAWKKDVIDVDFKVL